MRIRISTLVLVALAAFTSRAQNVTGTYGDVIVNGDGLRADLGVVLRGKTRPYVAVQMGAGSDGGFVVFNSANTELLRVTSGGNVAIGQITAAPRSVLHVVRNNSDPNTNYGIGAELILENNAATIYDREALTFSSNSAARAQIRSGINASSASGDMTFLTGLYSLNTRMVLTSGGDVQINGNPALPSTATFKDTSNQGLGYGIRLEMPGNSDIQISGMQVGRWSAPVIQSLYAPLQLNPDSRQPVTMPSQLTVGDLDGDATLTVISGDNPGLPKVPTFTLARRDGGNGVIAEYTFTIEQPGKRLRLMYNATTTPPTPSELLTIEGGAAPKLVFNGSIVGAVYQDVAEWVPATSDVAPGTVVVLNPEKTNEVMASHRAYDERVAGVISAQPGLILGPAGEGREMVATTGRVRVRVDATVPIRVGDLLVTSNKPGAAMRSQPIDVGGVAIHRPGTIIGKALEPLERGEGDILVLLSLQ